jgi:hypothetical protein
MTLQPSVNKHVNRENSSQLRRQLLAGVIIEEPLECAVRGGAGEQELVVLMELAGVMLDGLWSAGTKCLDQSLGNGEIFTVVNSDREGATVVSQYDEGVQIKKKWANLKPIKQYPAPSK